MQRGFGVTVFPYETKFEELEIGFGGIVISNGLGDRKELLTRYRAGANRD